MFVSNARLLKLALDQGSLGRLHLVLTRIQAEQNRPPNIKPSMVAQCIQKLLDQLLLSRSRVRDTVLEAVDLLAGIIRRWGLLRHQDIDLWNMARAVSNDLREDHCMRRKYIHALHATDKAQLVQVLRSSVISVQMVADLHTHISGNGSGHGELATAFYCSAIARFSCPAVPQGILLEMAAQHDPALAVADSRDCNGEVAVTIAALAHLYISTRDYNALEQVLARFEALTVCARWPMGASAVAVRDLVAGEYLDHASKLLQATADRNHQAFVDCLQGLPERTLNLPALKLSLLDDELAIRRHILQQPPGPTTGLSSPDFLPATAFFAPRLVTRFSDPGLDQRIRDHYSKLDNRDEQEDASATAAVIQQRVVEASAWSFRLQSSVPMTLMVQSLAPYVGKGDEALHRQLLLSLTRTLRNLSMMRCTENMCQEPEPEQQIDTPVPAAVRCADACYTDTLSRFDNTRRAILREYLRQGITPTPEELSIFQLHFDSCGHAGAQELAIQILPHIPPAMVSWRSTGHLAAQAYYQHLLLIASQQMDPGKLLSLFRYLLGHHRVDSAEFRKHILARTVVAYLRQAHFVGLGFFRLEREFIKLVTKDRFTTEYLNTTIPRFWALHTFLRRKRYVPRLKLYGRQIYIHKNALYRLLPTLIPKRSEMETLSDNDRCIELVIDHDIASAIHTFLHAAPRSAPGSRGSSVDWMIQYKARMVYPDEPSSIKAQ